MPLTLACQGGHIELVQLLVLRGVDLKLREKKGFMPLILSATGGFSEICEILLEAGVDIETEANINLTGPKIRHYPLPICSAKNEHCNVSGWTRLSLAVLE